MARLEAQYLGVVSLAGPLKLVQTAASQFLLGLHRPMIVFVATAIGVLINLLFNWVLIFGHLGAPALGPVGSAWSSTVSRWVMFLGVAALGWDRLRGHFGSTPSAATSPGARISFGQLVRLGIPIGTTMVLEFPVPALAPDELRRVRQAAARQIDIEARVMAVPEAAGVCVPDATLDSAVAEIRSRLGRVVAGELKKLRPGSAAGLVSGWSGEIRGLLGKAGLVKEGANSLSLQVTPTLRNMLVGYANSGAPLYRQYKKGSTMPAGLIGEVKLCKLRE